MGSVINGHSREDDMIKNDLNKIQWVDQRKKDCLAIIEECKRVANEILKCKDCVYAKSSRYDLGILLTSFYGFSLDKETEINEEKRERKMSEIDYLIKNLGDKFNDGNKQLKEILEECKEFINKLYLYEDLFNKEKDKKKIKVSPEYNNLIIATKELLNLIDNEEEE